MVATTGGVGLGLATFASLSGAGVWIIVFLVTRYASVASMVSAATLPLFAILFGASWPVIAFTVGAASGIVLLHKANIARLFRGTENAASSEAAGGPVRLNPSLRHSKGRNPGGSESNRTAFRAIHVKSRAGAGGHKHGVDEGSR